ncbi:hypothetical protein ACLB2K_014751 [Fragaria x ananassa]
MAFKEILSTYAKASGQHINLQKSSVAFSKNVGPREKSRMADVLGVECVEEHGLYLGIPLQVGRNKTAILSFLKEKLSKKLISWRSKLISSGGKELLIKVVAQTIPNYVMNCYALPKSLCEDLQQLCSMLAKQGWRLLTNPNSLAAQIFKAVYHPTTSFLEADMCDKTSYAWRSIKEARPILKAGLQWRIGNGTRVGIWSSDWIPGFPAQSLSQPHDTIFELVSNLIDDASWTWNRHAVYACFPQQVADVVLQIPLNSRFTQDKLAWKFEQKGFFSVKSAYSAVRDIYIGGNIASTSAGDPYWPIWRALWKAKVPNKVAIFGWRAAHNLLPTRAALSLKGYNGDLSCVVCNQSVESLEHLFCTCNLSREIFGNPPFSFPQSHIAWKDWLLERAVTLTPAMFDKFLVLLWSIWRNRNEVLWRDKGKSHHQIIIAAMAWYEEYLQANVAHQKSSAANRQRGRFWKPPIGTALKLSVNGASSLLLTRVVLVV